MRPACTVLACGVLTLAGLLTIAAWVTDQAGQALAHLGDAP